MVALIFVFISSVSYLTFLPTIPKKMKCCDVLESFPLQLEQLSVFQPAENAQDDLSDSDTEELVEIKIDDWLVFQLEREVKK